MKGDIDVRKVREGVEGLRKQAKEIEEDIRKMGIKFGYRAR